MTNTLSVQAKVEVGQPTATGLTLELQGLGDVPFSKISSVLGSWKGLVSRFRQARRQDGHHELPGSLGLNASSKNLEVIGNNAAKRQHRGLPSPPRAEFSNLYANASSAAAVQIGIGTSVQAVTQQFDQGNPGA